MDTTQRLKEKAIACLTHRLQEPCETGGALGATPDGHLQDPPVYPTYSTDPHRLTTRADADGIWVSWEQQAADGASWETASMFFPYAELR